MLTARDYAQIHGGLWNGHYATLPAPGHSRRDKGVTIHDRDDGRGVIVNAFNCDWRDVRDAYGIKADARPMTASERQVFARERAKRDAERAARQLAEARDMWDGGQNATPQSIVAAYLHHRGLPSAAISAALACGQLRAHPNALGRPAMLALARRADGAPQAVQITRLRPNGLGKAVVQSPRTTAGASKGCAVRLQPVADALAIAEGTETALAFSALHGVPAWASLGTENLATFTPPRNVRVLYIAADGDDAGAEAADALVFRMRRDIRCIVAAAPAGKDWADVITEART